MLVFSVVLPAFNREVAFKKALSSVLKQTYKNFKCYVVDDGSAQNLKKVFSEVVKNDDRFYYFKTPKNNGVAAARNYGVKKGYEKWLTFLDSDDVWLSNKLALQYKAIKENKQYVFFETYCKWFKNDKQVTVPKKYKNCSGSAFNNNLMQCTIATSAVTIRRDVFEYFGGFNSSLRACEDYELWLRVLIFMPLYVIKKELTYRFQGNAPQLSTSSGPLDYFRILSLKNVINFCNSKIAIFSNLKKINNSSNTFFFSSGNSNSSKKITNNFRSNYNNSFFFALNNILLNFENYNNLTKSNNTKKKNLNLLLNDRTSEAISTLQEKRIVLKAAYKKKISFFYKGALKRKNYLLIFSLLVKIVLIKLAKPVK